MNEVQIFDETKNILEILQFSKSYDKSKVKCSVKDENGEDKVLRVVELLHKPKSVTGPKTLPRTFKETINTKSSSRNKKKTMFTCVVEEEVTTEPKYVWIDGQLKEMTPNEAVDASDQKKKYMCKVIPKGIKKMDKMSKDLKIMKKMFRKFSKTLTQMTSPIDET